MGILDIIQKLGGGQNAAPALPNGNMEEYADPFDGMNPLLKVGIGLGGVGAVNNHRNAAYKQQDKQKQGQKKQALKELAERIQRGEISREQGLAEYAGVTGDYSGMFGGGSDPAALRIFDRVEKMSPEQRDLFFRTQRGAKTLDLGDRSVVVDAQGNVIKEFQENLKPGERPGTKYDQSRATEEGKLQGRRDGDEAGLEGEVAAEKERAVFQQQGRQTLPKVKRTLEAKELRDDFLDKKIDSIMERANPWTTGFTGSISSAIPGTDAFDLKQDTETLLANAGFDRLQEMRDNSPTGGALGQVSERELGLLQSAAQNLLTSQSEEQFKRNLTTFKDQRRKSLEAVRRAYEEDQRLFGSNDGGKAAPQSGGTPAQQGERRVIKFGDLK